MGAYPPFIRLAAMMDRNRPTFNLAKTRVPVIETLESRRVLTAVAQPTLPLSTPDTNAALVTTYSDSHVRVRDSRGGYFIKTERLQHNAPNGEPNQILSGDFNGDGVTDILGVDAANDWWLQLNDGTQLFQIPVGTGLPNARHLGTADFDQDGRLDVISIDDDGGLWVSRNQTDGFVHEHWGDFAHKTGWSQIFVGDYNGDGLTDVLGGEAGGSWWLAKNTGEGDFNNYHWGRYADFDWANVLDGEFTNDEHADVVARAPDNTWWIWEGTETGFKSARYFGHWKMHSEWNGVSVGDFNGDQINDVVGRASDGTLWVGSTIGDSFNTWRWGSGWIASADWSQVTVIDLNGDGLDDQVGHAADHTWWYALSHGNGFRNHFWNKGGEADFVVQNFRLEQGIDLIDSLPEGGKDPRTVSSSSNPEKASVDPSVLGPLRTYGIHAEHNQQYFKSLSDPPSKDIVRTTAELETAVSVTVVDGKVVLHGPIFELRGIQARSEGGFLSLESVEIPPLGEVYLADPFTPATGVILQNDPQQVVIGTLGTAANLEGETETSIRYSGTKDVMATDLRIDIGVGEEIFTLLAE